MEKLNIPDVIPDNDAAYFSILEEKIILEDKGAQLIVKSSIEGLVISILPSIPILKVELVKVIRKLHYQLNIKIEFSKSLLISKYITFKVKVW